MPGEYACYFYCKSPKDDHEKVLDEYESNVVCSYLFDRLKDIQLSLEE